MNQGKLSIVLTICFLFFSSCFFNRDNDSPILPESGQMIIPDSGREDRVIYSTNITAIEANEKEHLVPSIPIETKWRVIRLMDINLDSDTDEEQIIILEPVNNSDEDLSDTLEIWIADFNGTSNNYILAWKGTLNSRLTQSLTISVNEAHEKDEYEIYVLGYTAKNLHTLDVFYPLSSVSPSFRNIFSRSVKGTIELYYPQTAGSSLSDDYGTRVRISPNVIITQSDPDSTNLLDSIISTWELFLKPTRYKLVSSRKVVASQEQEEKLIELINGTVEQFEEILVDYWYREEADSDSIRMINLDKERERIEFLTLQDFESYQWTSSHKSAYAPRLYLYSTSLYISTVQKELTINMVDTDTISLAVFDNGKQHINNSWSGNYKRMTEGMKQSLIKDFERNINNDDYDLRGKYKSASGDELSFDKNRFTLQSADKEDLESGYFTLFLLNDEQIIEFVYFDHRGIKLKREIYNFSYAVDDDRDHRIRSLTIIPGEVNVRGFIPSEERGRRFEQIELLSE